MSEIQHSASLAAMLRALTPARVALGRTGVSIETRDLLDFQQAHAQARDAVHARLETPALSATLKEILAKVAQSQVDVLRLHSAAADRVIYLQRPDLGRRLDDASRGLIANQYTSSDASKLKWEIALIVADGLSALAVERHVPPLLRELLPRLEGWSLAPICIVEQGRVAIGDEIGLALCARISVVLIGERPGLSSPDSLGAYTTWDPRPGRTDAERGCISNIRLEGLSYAHAGVQLSAYIAEARQRKLTGVSRMKESHLLKGDGTE